MPAGRHALDGVEAEVVVGEVDGLQDRGPAPSISASMTIFSIDAESPPSSQPAAWLMRWLWLRMQACSEKAVS